jgi:hypothetical protein
MPNFVKSLFNVKEERSTRFLSFCAFFYFVDISLSLLDCGVVGSEAELGRGDDVSNGYCFFKPREEKSFEYFG